MGDDREIFPFLFGEILVEGPRLERPVREEEASFGLNPNKWDEAEIILAIAAEVLIAHGVTEFIALLDFCESPDKGLVNQLLTVGLQRKIEELC